MEIKLNKTELKKFYSNILKDKFFTLTIGNQRLPTFFYHGRGGFNKVEELRNLLLESRLDRERKFGRDYDNIYKFNEDKLDYIEQFPILITKSDVWKSICSEVGCDKILKDNKGNYYWERSLFVLDYYIPKLKLAIELDYDSSHTCPEYDKARDIYIKEEYEIDTIRFRDYELDPDKTREARIQLNKIIAGKIPSLEEKQVAKTSSFLRFPLFYYKEELDVLEAIKSENIIEDGILKLKYPLEKYYTLSRHKRTKMSLSRLHDLLEKLEIKVEE